MQLIFAGSSASVIRALEQLHVKDWRDIDAALTALRESKWDEVRAELNEVKPRWWRKGYQEIWITTVSSTVRVFYSRRPA